MLKNNLNTTNYTISQLLGVGNSIQYQKLQQNISQSLIELKKGDIFTNDQLKNLKEKLQIQFSARISRISCLSKLKFICKSRMLQNSKQNNSLIKNSFSNNSSTINCQFQLSFKLIQENRNYQLEQFNCQHKQSCKFKGQQMAFYRNKKALLNLKPLIYEFMKSRYQNYGFEKPKKLLPLITEAVKNQNLCQKNGLCGKYLLRQQFFLYKDIEGGEYKKKLKKKFDNVIGEMRMKLIRQKGLKKNDFISVKEIDQSLFINKNIKKQNNQQDVYLQDQQISGLSQVNHLKNIIQSKEYQQKQNINYSQKSVKKSRNSKKKMMNRFIKNQNLKLPLENVQNNQKSPQSPLLKNQSINNSQSDPNKYLFDYSTYNYQWTTPSKNFVFYVQTPQKKDSSIFKTILQSSANRYNYYEDDDYFEFDV